MIDAPLYQNDLGSDVAPPNPIAFGLNPAAAADSYITTPGTTGMAGGGFGTFSSWFDTSNDSAQTDFNFAGSRRAPRATFRASSRCSYTATLSRCRLNSSCQGRRQTFLKSGRNTRWC